MTQALDGPPVNPEGARSRARSVAALTASGAAAVAAGLVLTPATQSLPTAALLATGVAALALLVSTALFARASLLALNRGFADSRGQQAAAQSLILSIRTWTKAGSCVALIALAAIAIALSIVIWESQQVTQVKVTLTPQQVATLAGECPAIEAHFEATTKVSAATWAGPMATFRLAAEECGGGEAVTLTVPVASIRQIVSRE